MAFRMNPNPPPLTTDPLNTKLFVSGFPMFTDIPCSGCHWDHGMDGALLAPPTPVQSETWEDVELVLLSFLSKLQKPRQEANMPLVDSLLAFHTTLTASLHQDCALRMTPPHPRGQPEAEESGPTAPVRASSVLWPGSVVCWSSVVPGTVVEEVRIVQ